jgi:hypothetical protein
LICCFGGHVDHRVGHDGAIFGVVLAKAEASGTDNATEGKRGSGDE